MYYGINQQVLIKGGDFLIIEHIKELNIEQMKNQLKMGRIEEGRYMSVNGHVFYFRNNSVIKPKMDESELKNESFVVWLNEQYTDKTKLQFPIMVDVFNDEESETSFYYEENTVTLSELKNKHQYLKRVRVYVPNINMDNVLDNFHDEKGDFIRKYSRILWDDENGFSDDSLFIDKLNDYIHHIDRYNEEYNITDGLIV